MSFPYIRCICVLVGYALCLTSVAAAQQDSKNASSSAAITNRDIILMTRSKFDDATIVKTIQAFETQLDVSVTAMVALKDAGVTQPVIQAMLAKATEGGKAQPVVDSSPSPATSAGPSRQKEPATNFVATSTNPYGQASQSDEKSDEPNRPVKGSLSRVYLESVSSGTNRNAARDQSMEMAKDFLKVCPNVRITLYQNAADYTIRLNHIEHGWIYRDNQIEVFDRNGDLMHNKEGGSIKRNVQQACELIYSDWAQQTGN
ncbi:MAG TPA: hypothetical protein VGH83_01285 [Candidatus Acidoferrum sp.]|jgi:hypothetical protein